MLNKRLIVGILTVVLLFLGIFSFAQGRNNNETTGDASIPVITLKGDKEVTIEVGSQYEDAGATATDEEDGDLTEEIVINNPVDTSVVANYTITYDVTDSDDNDAVQVTRTVKVVDTTIPVITMIGGNVTIKVGGNFVDPGATATDNYDENITGAIITTGNVNTNAIGTYAITYNVKDANGNEAVPVQRTVFVVDDELPLISLNGDAEVTIEVGLTYVDAGATAVDNYDGDITGRIVVGGNVDTNVVGTYIITYNVTDNEGNQALEVTRTVNVVDTTKPIITGVVDGKYYKTDVTITVDEKYIKSVTDNGNPIVLDKDNKYVFTDENVHNVVVTDESNNTATVTFTIDKTAPTFTVTGNTSVWIKDPVTLTINASDNLSGLAGEPYSFDEGTTWVSTNSKEYIVYKMVKIVVRDKAGNESVTHVEHVLIDVRNPIAPTIEIKEKTAENVWINYDQDWTNNDVKVNLSIKDNGSGFNRFEYSFDGTTWTTTASEIIFNTEMNSQVWFRAVDNVGLEGAAAGPYSIKIDKTAPSFTVTGNTSTWTKNPVALTINASDSLSGLADKAYSFDAGTTWVSTNSKEYTGYSMVKIVVRDSVGNESTIRVEQVLIDVRNPIAPTVELKEQMNENSWIDYDQEWTNSNVKVKLSITDNGSGFNRFEYSLNGTTWTTTTSEITFNTETNSQVWFRAVDNVGLEGAVAGPYNIKIDKIAPSYTVSGNDGWVKTSIILTINASDSLSSLADAPYSFNGGTTWQSSPTATFTEEGSIEIAVKDYAGNVSSVTPVSLLIDKSNPVISIDLHNSAVYAKTHTATGKVTDAKSGIDTVKYIWSETEPSVSDFATANDLIIDANGNFTLVEDSKTLSGIYFLWIYALDNVDYALKAGSDAYYFDNTAPSTPTVTATVDGVAYNGTVTTKNIKLEFSSNDSHSGVDKYQWTISGTNNWEDITNPLIIDWNLDKTYIFRSLDKAGNPSVSSSPVILKRTSDIEGPNVTFNYQITGRHQTKTDINNVTVTDPSNVNTATLKYLWTFERNENNIRLYLTWFVPFNINGSGTSTDLPKQQGDNPYLWIIARDTLGNETLTRSDYIW